jgi:predicted glycosyltransferase involved in capsule biosynthesis
MEKDILLTILTYGKNDGYQGGFANTMELYLNKLLDNIDKLSSSSIEVICVDWGSPPSEKLSDVINTPPNPFLKFIYVSEEIAAKYSPNFGFSLPHALNCGVRQSKGKYVLINDADVYTPYDSFLKTYNLVESKNGEDLWYWGSRYHLPSTIHLNASSTKEIDDAIEKWQKNGKKGWTFHKINSKGGTFSGGAGSLLISKSRFEECTGWYEVLTKWGWMDAEFHHRYGQKNSYLGDLWDLGISVFHLNHHNFDSRSMKERNPTLRAPQYRANGDNWGLGEENIEIYKL